MSRGFLSNCFAEHEWPLCPSSIYTTQRPASDSTDSYPELLDNLSYPPERRSRVIEGDVFGHDEMGGASDETDGVTRYDLDWRMIQQVPSEE